jgi:hypothetical protein
MSIVPWARVPRAERAALEDGGHALLAWWFPEADQLDVELA